MAQTESSTCFCFNRKCCRGDEGSEKYSDSENYRNSSSVKPAPDRELKILPYTTSADEKQAVSSITLTKDSLVRSNSGPQENYPPIKVSAVDNMSYTPVKVSPHTNETSLSGSSIDGTTIRDTSQEYRQHQVDVFKQGIKNTELINSGGIIEANHKYISRVLMPTSNGLSSRPSSRANSVKRPIRALRLSSEVLNESGGTKQRQIIRRNTERINTGNTLDADVSYMSRRNTEKINTGRTIEAQHTYTTTVGIPLTGYYSHPHSRTSSLKRPVHILLTPGDLLLRKESWYRRGAYLTRTRAPISRSSSVGFQL